MTELIVLVLAGEFPDWTPPQRDSAEWMQTCCPFHGDMHPSAGISLRNNAFICHACGEKGDAVGLLAKMKGVTRREAIEIAEGISPGSVQQLQGKPTGKPRRRTFGQAGTTGGPDGRPVRTGLRRGSAARS